MTIVAFLQNMWVRDPVRLQKTIARAAARDPSEGDELRRRMIAYALFAGCLTGRRLKSALGEDLCDRIIWDEASPFIADNPRDYHPPDPAHIRAVLARHRPGLVLCFTRRGYPALRAACPAELRIFDAPHPAARGTDVCKALAALKLVIEEYERDHR